MNILLNVIYGTSFGEELVLNLITGTDDETRQSTPYRMRTVDGREWTCNLKFDLKKALISIITTAWCVARTMSSGASGL